MTHSQNVKKSLQNVKQSKSDTVAIELLSQDIKGIISIGLKIPMRIELSKSKSTNEDYDKVNMLIMK